MHIVHLLMLNVVIAKLRDKPFLAIVWRCEHFNLYLYESDIKLIGDHKPLA